MKILALLLIAFALTGGELADSPLQQRVLTLKNALMPGEPGYYAVQRELPGKKLFRDWLILRKEIAATPEQVGEAEEKLKGTEERLNIGVRWPYSAGPSVRIPKLTVKPVIDGTLAPGEWDDAVMFDSHYHKNAARPAANSEQKWRFAWDNRYFYAAGEFLDSSMVMNHLDWSTATVPWKACCAELFLMTSRDIGIYWEFIVLPDGANYWFVNRSNAEGANSYLNNYTPDGVQIAAKMNANGYSVEIAVPFRLMPNYQLGNRPKPGEKIRFMPVLVKNGKYSSPFPLLYDGHNLECYAEGTLVHAYRQETIAKDKK